MAGTGNMLGGLSAQTLVAFVAATAMFSVWPELDLWVSGLFHDGTDFPLVGAYGLEISRHLIWTASNVTATGALGLWLCWLCLGAAAEVPARLWGWVAAVYVVGPGILVNGVLKAESGRARPAQVLGGEAEFTRLFEIADQCTRNCAFVSGETAAAVTLAIVWGAVLSQRGPGKRRWRVAAILATVALLASLLRILTGRHFLSDVVFAAFLVVFVARGLWIMLDVSAARDALTLPALRADCRGIRTRFRKLWLRVLA